MREAHRAMKRPRDWAHCTKAYAQGVHAIRRAAERYGLRIGKRTLQRLVADIQQGRGTFIRRQSNRVSLWQLNVEGRPVRVVYDRLRKTIVTFLPPESAGGANDQRDDGSDDTDR